MINTLHKAERLNRKKVIEKMFAGGSRSFSLFPLRVVWLPVEELAAPVSILVSVSKRRFKRAVKRNRVKRRVREAYSRWFSELCSKESALFNRYRVDSVEIPTGSDYVKSLMALFNRR